MCVMPKPHGPGLKVQWVLTISLWPTPVALAWALHLWHPQLCALMHMEVLALVCSASRAALRSALTCGCGSAETLTRARMLWPFRLADLAGVLPRACHVQCQ